MDAEKIQSTKTDYLVQIPNIYAHYDKRKHDSRKQRKYEIIADTQYTKQNCKAEFWEVKMQNLLKKDGYDIGRFSDATEQGETHL